MNPHRLTFHLISLCLVLTSINIVAGQKHTEYQGGREEKVGAGFRKMLMRKPNDVGSEIATAADYRAGKAAREQSVRQGA